MIVEEVSFATLKSRLHEFYLSDGPGQEKFRRFKEYPVVRRSKLFWPYWKLDEAFDSARHVLQHTEAIDHHGLELWLAQEQVAELEPTHPLFQFHVFERYTTERGERRSAVILKVHHCYNDGFGFLRMIFL